MKKIQVVIKNLSELILSRKETSTNFTESQSFIRGSRFYGAFGKYLIEQNGLVSEILQQKQKPEDLAKKITSPKDFEELFKQYYEKNTDNKRPFVSFSDAIPIDKDYGKDNVFYIVSPKVLYECRKFDSDYFQTGASPEAKKRNRHLIIAIKNEIKKKKMTIEAERANTQRNLMDFISIDVCPHCGSPMKKRKSEFIKIEIKNNNQLAVVNEINVSKSWKMGISRDNSLKTVKEEHKDSAGEVKGQLFALEYVDPGQLYLLNIEFDEEVIKQEQIIDFLNQAKIGAKTNSGFGDIEVQSDEKTKVKELSKDQLKKQIKESYNQWKSKGIEEAIPLYCMSDLAMGEKEFNELITKNIQNAEIHSVSSAKKQIMLYFYFEGAMGSQQVNVIERGSVFLIYKQGGFNDDDLEHLADLTFQRIGQLSERGFGEIVLIPQYFL